MRPPRRPGLSAFTTIPWLLIWIVGYTATVALGTTAEHLSALRASTRDLFWHGYSNYLDHAFPEDELKPISCRPQTRSRENPADIGLNDVLGNYSVTLVDSLSTLAILASDADEREAEKALRGFQDGVKALVDLYGDGEGRCGSRACGFDLDSKVQVFETNIRGVGGLLSAHLFAIGELPIRAYDATTRERDGGIEWSNGLVYDGQILRLAHDLAKRLLPAFNTATGIPYPRVNLRHGIPFYRDAAEGVCRLDGTSSNPREITENCAAGAGSLVLEFSTLSRLTGDAQFEMLAKRAFWAIWSRRSMLNLVGGGIDAESGQWTLPALSGIGAGIDSFFEYALKSSILLSGVPEEDPQNSPDSFLATWRAAHAAIRRHVYRPATIEKHPFHAPSDLITGAQRYSWIDNLSAYYPGLLALAGEVDEAIETHLTYTALWTRYAALPERWMTHGAGYIDPSFRHWAGRPEFVESTWYLYRATKDPWLLATGEMALRDIRRRCWTKCGWADLGDVVSGEQRDRMESFFLGETAKYFYLLFTEDHPLNKGDRPIVFTTEGHPLAIPDALRTGSAPSQQTPVAEPGFCSAPPPPIPLTVSNIVARPDLFHASALANLHNTPVNPSRVASPLEPSSPSSPGISLADLRSPTNYTYYPWTLHASLIPTHGISSPIRSPVISTLTFPSLEHAGGSNPPNPPSPLVRPNALQKVLEGVLVNSLSNLRLSMVQEPRSLLLLDGNGVLVEMEGMGEPEYRIQGIANWALGRDEKVLVTKEALEGVSAGDPHFTRVKDLEGVDLVIDSAAEIDAEAPANITTESLLGELGGLLSSMLPASLSLSSPNPKPTSAPTRHLIPAILPTGPGAAPLPTFLEPSEFTTTTALPATTIFHLESHLCFPSRLPAHIAKQYQILILPRGGCSFAEKLSNIPAQAPSETGLQLVVVVSGPGQDGPEGALVRPLLDKVQRTANGFERRHAIAMVMVEGTEEVKNVLEGAVSAKGGWDESGEWREEVVKRGAEGGAMAVKRRYWFESMGVVIGNLIMV